MQRKKFITTGCTLCVGAIAGMSSLALLQGCATGKIIKQEPVENKLTIDIAAFTKENPFIILRTKKLNYDVFVHQQSETNYNAILMQCSHYDNPVFANKKELFCPSHGSKFSFDGKVTKEPAVADLKKYPTEIKNNQLVINIS